MIEILICFVIGIAAGIFTGLMPGIHINLVSVAIVSSLAFFTSFVSPLALVVFIVSMTITHTFLDFIPSIFLGAPDEDTALSVLPGHKLLLQGKGEEAVWLTLSGFLVGLPIIILFTFLFIKFLPSLYPYFKTIIPFILIAISFFMIITEKSKIKSLIIFILAGCLGIATLNLPLKEPLFPLLTGLFGCSTLLISIKEKIKLKKQQRIKFELPKKTQMLNVAAASAISAPLCSFLPGLGSSQAAIIGSEVAGDIDDKQFLILVGAINFIVSSLSFIALYSINKARTGTALAVKNILQSLSSETLLVILVVILISSIISFFLATKITRFFSQNITKFNYQKISLAVLILLAILTFIFSGWLGFLVLIVSTALGITAVFFNVRRTQLMACLLLPTILFYLL